jgi:6-phosphofructokinase
MSAISRIGVLTGGGDAPGLNAVIRAVVKSAANSGVETVGIEDSFDGLLEVDRSRVLTPRDVTGILRLGGTILGTLNTGNPVTFDVPTSDGPRKYADRVLEIYRRLDLDALIAIGGDGTLAISHEFCQLGMPIVCVPKTIDNDIVGTTNCFGFDTAVAFATDAIDRLHTTAEAHKRILVVEVMGRYAGWIALYAGVAGGADAILIPEIPFDIALVAQRLRDRDKWGAKFSIVVVAEGAFPKGGSLSLLEAAHGRSAERLGGIGAAARRPASIASSRRGSAARRWSSCCGANSGRWSPLRHRASSRAASTMWWGRRRRCRWISICWRPRKRWASPSVTDARAFVNCQFRGVN